jgi:hypothetical protein
MALAVKLKAETKNQAEIYSLTGGGAMTRQWIRDGGASIQDDCYYESSISA